MKKCEAEPEKKIHLFDEWFSNWGDFFLPQGTFGNFWRLFFVTTRGKGATTGIYWVEAMDVAKHPTTHRTEAHHRESSSPDTDSSMVKET